MTKNELRAIRAYAEMFDDLLIDGKPPVIGSLRRFSPKPTTKAIIDYRRSFPSEKANNEINRLLSQSRADELELDGDIVFANARPDRENWMHAELVFRGQCFSILESNDLQCWGKDLPGENWLLVEGRRIVGAAQFTVMITAPGTPWLWEWVFIDPQYRRRGIVSSRLPRWVEHYGRDLLVDQPNPPAGALLKKAGYRDLRVRGRLSRVVETGLHVHPVHQSVDEYELVEVMYNPETNMRDPRFRMRALQRFFELCPNAR